LLKAKIYSPVGGIYPASPSYHCYPISLKKNNNYKEISTPPFSTLTFLLWGKNFFITMISGKENNRDTSMTEENAEILLSFLPSFFPSFLSSLSLSLSLSF
jgi:hypothetical protein